MTTNPAAIAALAKGDIENAKVASTPGGIEAQEKAGQTALVQSTDMPAEMRPNQEAFERIGFTFGEAIDELFLSATLPPGWTRAATDHSMHSVLLDEKGRERVTIFYKAAFYDRRADSSLKCRYTTMTIYDDEDNDIDKDHVAIVIADAGKEKTRFATVAYDDWNARDKQGNKARKTLLKQFPKADNPTAYWDD